MFEASLKEKLKLIFDFDKVTFDDPGEAEEQECIFIQVDKSQAKIAPPWQSCKVDGKITVYCNADKMPFGYMMKKIQESDPANTADLFFFDQEESQNRFQNIVARTMSFVYFYKSQYNPEVGEITSINLEVD